MNNSIFKTGGALTAEDRDIYIERLADNIILKEALSMNYVLVIEPRQQGKTSLINSMMRSQSLSNYLIVYIDTSTLEHSSMGEWYGSLANRIIRQINSMNKILEVKIPINGSGWREFLYLISTIAQDLEQKVIIALDEIGTSEFQWATDFFSVLRDIFNSRQVESQFNSITFLLVGAFHPRDLITDYRISPFNIAHRVRLSDFTQEDVLKLMLKVGWSENILFDLAREVHYWTRGQPYLTQLLCSYLSKKNNSTNVNAWIEQLRQEDENHIPPILAKIESDKALQVYIKKILSGDQIKFYPRENRLQATLELIGLIKGDQNGFCTIRNPVYELVLSSMFDASLGKGKSIIENKSNFDSLMNNQSFKRHRGRNNSNRGIEFDQEITELRIGHLMDNLTKDLELLKEYEDAIRYETDPRQKVKYYHEIEKIRNSVMGYQQEYDKLSRLIPIRSSRNIIDVQDKLSHIDAKLDNIALLQHKIDEDMSRLNAGILIGFETSERKIITNVIGYLDEREQRVIEAFYIALEQNNISSDEIQEVLDKMNLLLSNIQTSDYAQSDLALTFPIEHVLEVISSPKFDAIHKLKLAIPIIPFMLSYESEFQIKSGVDLGKLWQWLISVALN